MKKLMFFVVFASMIGLFAGKVRVTESLVDSVRVGCKEELASYCKNVTPGEGCVLACLYAHGDKLSGRCEYALYDAAAQLEMMVDALSYVANECKDDLKKYCSGVKAGVGRLAECLLIKNKSRISRRCAQAVEDVGLRVEKK